MPDSFPRTRELIRRSHDSGQSLGCQLYLSIHGAPRLDHAFGQSRPGQPLRNTDLMLWLSATKPIAAVAVAQLWERDTLDLDDPVAKHVPEFAAKGKERVTIRHLLTHTAGFRGVANTWSTGSWDALIHRICNAPLEPGWTPGKKAGYHVASSWFILGELIRRLDGRPFEQYVREEIFLPLGMHDSWVGMPVEELRRYESESRVVTMFNTAQGSLDDSYPGNREENIVGSRPAGNGRGPARELARLYECFLGRGRIGDATLLKPQTVEAMVARHRVGMMDQTFRHLIDWGLGVIVNSAHYGQATLPYGFGPHASARTFGHSGSQSSIAFADPEHHLACAVVFNTMPGDDAHQTRIHALLGAIYADLGIVQ